MDKNLDLAERKRSLRNFIEYQISYAKTDGTGAYDSNIVWSSSHELACFQIEGSLFESEPEMLQAGKAAVLQMANYCIANEVWHRWTPPWSDAWVHPNLALIDDRWWREGVIDTAQVAAIFDKQEDWMYGSTLAAISMADFLLSVGAYHLIEPMLATPNAMSPSHPRAPSPADRLGLALANDPGQLHDPKSPVRKSARSIMRRNMERWFMSSGGLLPYHWLRTFEWREGQSGLSPRESMLRAYAYMPDVEPPPGIAREVAQLRKIPV